MSFQRFAQDLKKGGSGAWWIRQRAITLDEGDKVSAANVGGIFHTFTEVAAFGRGCIKEFNVAVTETVENCHGFSQFPTTGVPQGETLAAQALPVGVHRFQCLIHPWMRSVVTVKAT